jgi:hypothetical protein
MLTSYTNLKNIKYQSRVIYQEHKKYNRLSYMKSCWKPHFRTQKQKLNLAKLNFKSERIGPPTLHT